jgi:hypothetical protein
VKHALSAAMIIGAALLASCGTKNDANEQNLAAAISANMEGNKGALCLMRSGRGAYSFPSIYGKPELNNFATPVLREQLAALEKVGLIRRSVGTSSVIQQDGTVFNLTPEGQKYAIETSRRALDPNALDEGKAWTFCFAKARLDKVVGWTEPDPVAHQSQVTYTYKVEDLAPWANDGRVKDAFPEIAAAGKEAGEAKLQVLLQQRADGWASPN